MYKLHVSRIENQQPGNKHAAKLIQTADASTIIHLVKLRHLPAYNNVHAAERQHALFVKFQTKTNTLLESTAEKQMLSAKIQHHISRITSTNYWTHKPHQQIFHFCKKHMHC